MCEEIFSTVHIGQRPNAKLAYFINVLAFNPEFALRLLR
jgi:hypothetical protein